MNNTITKEDINFLTSLALDKAIELHAKGYEKDAYLFDAIALKLLHTFATA